MSESGSVPVSAEGRGGRYDDCERAGAATVSGEIPPPCAVTATLEPPPGGQDLVVNILARGQRYEPANYASILADTNVEVNDAAKAQFAPMHEALLELALKRNPRGIVTEFAGLVPASHPRLAAVVVIDDPSGTLYYASDVAAPSA